MRSLSLVLSGDDADLPYPSPIMKCARCHRVLNFVGIRTMDFRDWLHGDDASEICEPIGIYRA